MQQVESTIRERWRAAFVALSLLALAGCTPPGKPNPANRPVMPDQITDFDQLYAMNCAGCHGKAGELGPAPPLADPLFMAIIPDDVLQGVIRRGRAGTPMPAFAADHGGSLTEAQLQSLAEGIKTRWKSDSYVVATDAPRYVVANFEGASSDQARKRGKEVFSRACAGCHGPGGAGIEADGAIANALRVPAFLALISDQALRRIIITGRPDLGMPNFAEREGRPADFRPLTSGEVDDLVALLASWRTAVPIVANDTLEKDLPENERK
jgi:cytochrome c oxidase cbb3-type subunit III